MKTETIQNLRKWLGHEGLYFFKWVKKEHGKIDAVYSEGGIPHPVHFREGMEVRNFLRAQDECKDWDAHKLDNMWVSIIEEAIATEKVKE